MSGGVKLRRLIAWMAVMGCVAVLALGHVWKQNVHVGLSRELVKTSRERDVLAAEVLLLETETRGLRHYSRLETVARERLGLVNPGPPMVIQPAGQVVAAHGSSDDSQEGSARNSEKSSEKSSGKDSIRSARWKGFFR